MHQVGIVRYGRLFQASENSFGSAVFHRRLVHDPYGLPATGPGLRVGAENNRVARLDGHDALEQHRGGRVGNGGDREDQPDGFSHLRQAALWKLADYANGRFVLDVVVDEFRGHHVLDGLVFHDPEFGFLNRQASEVLSLVQTGQDRRFNDGVNLQLRELRKDGGGGFASPDQP